MCNLIPCHGKKGAGWATKDNPIVGMPDFALWNEGPLQPAEIHNVFMYLSDLINGGAPVKIGETLGLSGITLRIGPLSEFKDSIAGPGETLALRCEP